MRRPGVRRAFTIIELLVVIGIIAILASILLGSIALVKDQARKVKCAGNLKGWYRGLMAYATAPQNGGFLPCLASSGDSFYDRTPAMIKFFQDYDMDFRVAYSPSNPNLQAADDWTDFEWTVLEPDMAKALIIDNTGEFDSGVPVTFMANDEPPDTYTQVSGTWEELARTKPEDPYQGDKAHYSDTLGAKSTWAFDLRSTPGHGTLKLEAYIRKGPDGRTSAKYSDGTTSATICQYNATETYGWVTVGNFPVEGSAEPTFSVEAVEGGAAGPDIVWDGTAGKGLVAEADAASLTAGVTWTPITGANGKEYYSPIAAGNAAGSWNVTVPADYTGSLTLEAYFKVDSTGSNRGDVTYTVDGGQGITVSQKPQGSESTANWYWRTIGSFNFTGGTRTVTVAKAAGNNGRLWVGAIRLKGTLKGGLSGGGIVWDSTSGQFDDQTGPFSTPEGTWTADTVTTGAVGGSARRTESGTASALWTVTIPPNCIGTLQLEANIRKGPLGSTAAVYKIHGRDADTGDGQTATISMNSATDQSYGWVTVGSFQFEGGTRTVAVTQANAVPPPPTPVAPVAVNDSYAAVTGKTLNVYAYNGVLANDTDANSDALTATKLSNPAAGTLVFNQDGSFNYTPTATGTYTFTYKANDGTADSNVATVTITVSAPTDIAWDGTSTKGLVAEADAASLTAGVTWTPITGANGKEYYSPIAAGNAAGSWNVTVPADYTGSLTLEAYFKVDSTGSNRGDVTYTVDGGQGITVSQKPQGSESTANWYWRTIGSFTLSGGTRTVTVAKAAGNNGRLWVGAIRLKGTLTPINYAPTAASETYTAVAGSTLTVQAAKGVLSNDTDPENDQLSAVPVSGVSHGTLTLNADGSFVYTPTAGYSGADSFTYKAKETRVGGLESGVVTATFNVTLPPACVLCADAIRLTGTLTNPTGGTGRVWADALRLTGSWYGGTSGPEPTGNEYRVLDGAWSLSTALPEPSRYGPNYQIGARDGATRRVAWYFKVPESKSYSVFGWWPADSSRATDAQFTIISPTGQQTVTVSQADTANNGDWRALGSAADFRSDVVSRVELSNAGSGSKSVVADAIAIVPNDSMPHSRAVIGYLFFGYREQIGGTMMTGQEDVVLPSSAQEDNPGSVPLMADMYAPGAPAWTAHSDGVHILYMDGSVQWKSAGQTIPRWRDTFNQTFNW